MKRLLQTYYPVRIVLRIYGFGLVTFFFFRLLLLLTNFHILKDNSLTVSDIIRSFLYGFQFDLMVSSYLIFPIFLLLVLSFFHSKQRRLYTLAFWFTFVFFSIAFIISGADIPYFNNFFLRFNANAFEWLNTPLIVVKMILFEPRFRYILLPIVLILWIFYKIVKKIYRQKPEHIYPLQRKDIIIFSVFGLLMLGGILLKGYNTPISIYQSFDSKNVYLKYLFLNPVYTLSKSVEHRVEEKFYPKVLIDKNTAIRNMQHYLHIDSQKYKSPVARNVIPDTVNNSHPNVVLILMESMASYRMRHFGNTENLTPFLDSLYDKSLSFSNLYSSGTHTYFGIYSTLTGYPALYETHPMKAEMDVPYNNWAYTLKKHGYHTSFFIPHDAEFDNLQSFLSKNFFDDIYSVNDYQSEKRIGIYGVPDDYLFEIAVQKINQKQKQPFFAAILTVSNHSPYRFPDNYKDKETDERKKGVKYADWSIKKFMQLAQKQDWFDNTLFVFVADHGKVYSLDYDMPLNYHHIPLIIYKKDIKPQVIDKIAGQIDVFPTVMGQLRLPYINNSFGIDLMRETRPYILFNKDEKYGILSKNYFLITQKNKIIGLYKYQEKGLKNYARIEQDTLQRMDIYYKSHLETLKYMLQNGYQFIDLP